MSKSYKPMGIEWNNLNMSIQSYPDLLTSLSNLAIAETNLVKAGKDSALPHFIAIVKEIERIAGFKFVDYVEEEKRSIPDITLSSGEIVPLPVGEPFEEALHSFLNYVDHEKWSGLELSRLISCFINNRSSMGLSSRPERSSF